MNRPVASHLLGSLTVTLTVVAVAACGGDRPAPAAPAGPTSVAPAEEPVPRAPSPACAGIGTVLEGARTSFDPSMTVAGATTCYILPGNAPFPAAFECELAEPETEAKAQRVLDRWAADLATCPQLSAYRAEINPLGQAWMLELDDARTIEVQLSTGNEANTLPTLTVRVTRAARRPE